MFVYTVYGAPGVTRRGSSRRVEPVDRVDGVTPAQRSWTVRKDQVGLPAHSDTLSTQSEGSYGRMYARAAKAPEAETQQPRIGDLQIQMSPSVVMEHRGVKPSSVLNPNFSGAIDQLKSFRGGASATDYLNTTVREIVGAAMTNSR